MSPLTLIPISPLERVGLMLETVQNKGWLGFLIAGGAAAMILLLPFSSLAISNSVIKVIDEDEFPGSSFGAPPSQRDFAVLPHRPNPLAYD